MPATCIHNKCDRCVFVVWVYCLCACVSMYAYEKAVCVSVCLPVCMCEYVCMWSDCAKRVCLHGKWLTVCACVSMYACEKSGVCECVPACVLVWVCMQWEEMCACERVCVSWCVFKCILVWGYNAHYCTMHMWFSTWVRHRSQQELWVPLSTISLFWWRDSNKQQKSIKVAHNSYPLTQHAYILTQAHRQHQQTHSLTHITPSHAYILTQAHMHTLTHTALTHISHAYISQCTQAYIHTHMHTYSHKHTGRHTLTHTALLTCIHTHTNTHCQSFIMVFDYCICWPILRIGVKRMHKFAETISFLELLFSHL